MSILLKALKQAQEDRKAARERPLVANPLDAGVPADKHIGAAEPAVDEVPPIHAPAGSADDHQTSSPTATPAYGGLWITLFLAVVSAAAFGYWMRGMPPAQPHAVPSETVQAPAPAPVLMAAQSKIPALLRMDEAGPMRLQLDRQMNVERIRAR